MRTTRRIPHLLLTALLLVTLGHALVRPEQGRALATPEAGHRVPWNGGQWFAFGVNYPWHHYGNDFGGNAWGAFGVDADPTSYVDDFAAMAAKGTHVARWWVFGDGRAGITTDAAGTPTGLDPFVVRDLDRALTIADEAGIYLDLVLFDFHLLDKAQQVDGVQVGGRTSWMTDAAQRTALVDRVMIPLITRFGANPRIMFWEMMNEPEWAISDLPQADVDARVSPMTMAPFWDFSSRVTAAIHDKSGAYATMGSASLKWHKVWTNAFADRHGLPRLDLDVYQTHYYSWMDPWSWVDDPELGTTTFSPLTQPYDALGLDRPMVVGELEVGNATVLDRIYANGYAGAWAWSYGAGDDFAISWEIFTAWEAAHADAVRIDGGAATPTPVVTQVTGRVRSGAGTERQSE